MPKVSVVIPVYNTEPYLRECLDSVINQTLKDIEIILVDDGSTDGSAEICRNYADTDPRIKLIAQENLGAASARKNGIACAAAPYIGFVDSDDYIDPDMYETLLTHIGDCDLIVCGHYRDQAAVFDVIPQGVYRTSDEMRYIINNMVWSEPDGKSGLFGVVWNKLFRTEIAKKVSGEINPDIYSGEDSELSYRSILECDSVVLSGFCKYHYRLREDSVLHSAHHDFLQNIHNLYISLRERFQQHPSRETLMEQLQRKIFQMILVAPRRMGFSPKARMIEYISPFLNVLTDKKVALYGAGKVGQSYYLQMMKSPGNEPVIWVDKRHEHYQLQFPVRPVEDLAYVEYDHVLIAVEKEGLAQNIKQELLARGIAEEKILWKEPIRTIM